MKKYTMLAMFLVVIVVSLNAEILRVNDTPTAYAPYSSISAAVNAASAGDTILVEGGGYGSFQVDKSLTILGLGYNGTNWNNSIAYLDGYVTLQPGSNGTIISGFHFVPYTGGMNINSNNILIENINFNTRLVGVNAGATDITIRRCFDVRLSLSTCLNVICHNNKIIDISSSSVSELFLFNNIITVGGSVSVQNTYAYNNIFTDSDFSISSSTNINNIFQYNVCAGNFLSPYLNNILDVNMATQFSAGYELAILAFQ